MDESGDGTLSKLLAGSSESKVNVLEIRILGLRMMCV